MKYLRLVFFAFVVFCVGYLLKGQSASVVSVDHWGPTTGTVTVSPVEYDSENNRVRYELVSKPWSGAGGWSGAWGALYDVRAVLTPEAGGTSNVLTTVGQSVWLGASSNPWKIYLQGYWSLAGWIGNIEGQTVFTVNPVQDVKRVRIAGTHTGERPIRLVFRSGASDVIGTIDVQPGAVYDETFTVTPAQDAAGLHLDTFVQDSFQDGVWVQNETFDPGTATKVGSDEVSAVTLPPEGIPDASWQAYSNRGPSSSAPTAETSITGSWTASNYTSTTVDAERLDKATYREGVDKLEKALNGKASEVPAPPTAQGAPVFTAPSNPNRLENKLPSVPTVTAPTPVTAITVALEIPGITVAPITIDFDRPGFSGPVSVFRAILLGVMTLIYLVLSIRTVRGAFAGK
jgi:hypothetical protein